MIYEIPAPFKIRTSNMVECKIKQIPSKIDASTIDRNFTRDKTYLIEPKSSFGVCTLKLKTI